MHYHGSCCKVDAVTLDTEDAILGIYQDIPREDNAVKHPDRVLTSSNSTSLK